MSIEIPLPAQRNWYVAKHLETSKLVGRSQKERLRWLVETVAGASEGAPLNFGTAEIAVFLVNQGGAGTRLSVMPRIRAVDRLYLANAVKEGLVLIIDGKQWTVEIRESVDRILLRRTGVKGVDQDEPFGARSTWQPRSKAALLTAFLLTAADLIERQQSWLRRCPREDCGRVFVQEDRRQSYCSPRCSQTRRTRRFRRKIGR